VSIRIITASAGSGKTFRLTQELDQAIASGRARPESIIATTFTKHAAVELIERARTRLLQSGRGLDAHRLLAARIGTVNAVCGAIVADFAFELGMSPELRILDEAAAETEFRRALARVVTIEVANDVERLTAAFEREFDWRHETRRIVEGARANGLTAVDLSGCAARSILELDACMGHVAATAELDVTLADALDVAIAAITANGDTTKGTAEYLELLRSSRRDLTNDRLRWSDWAKLATAKPTKKSLAHAEAVQAQAAAHLAHPRLRAQMHDLIRILFGIAADALTAYQDYKRERGVLDFVDQETLALEVLRRPDARAALAGQIDLVLVDEFQDTSPIQLALFLELATLATESIWVGDPKQAIYGFRGTDPGLMDAAIESLTSTTTDADLVDRAAHAVTRGQIESLGISYRSRPALVAVTSAMFARAFEHQGMPADRTRLTPVSADEPAGLGSVLEYWPFDQAKNATDRACAVAAGVRDLLARATPVRDLAATRPARPSDVAVLCRTNAQCQDVANALDELGVAAVVPRMGLLDALEAMIVIAGLRLWVDPEDALAAAELARLVTHAEAIDPLVARALAAPGADAFRDDPTVARLLVARTARRDRDPLAALDAVIEATQARELAAAWGDSPQRLANLDALRGHAIAYVEEARASGDAASLAGLLRHLDELAVESWHTARTDSQALRAGDAAVTVSTWHAAKGLEWPVTILFGLESLREPRAHGVHVMSDRVDFDVSDPLGGRWIRFWPNPYVNLTQNGPVRDAYECSPAFETLKDRAQREALRVLYVGWTRARDRLVLTAQRGKLLDGLLGTLHAIDRALISEPTTTARTSTVSWAGEVVAIDTIPSQPAEPAHLPPVAGFTPIARPRHPRPRARASPSAMPPVPSAIGEVARLGPRLLLRGSPDMEAVGHAVHGFLAADRPGLDPGERASIATDLLHRFGVVDALAAVDVVAVADRFHAWLEARYPGARLHRECPVLHRTGDETVVAGTADLVVRIGDAAIVIDHKSFPGTPEAAVARAQTHSGQLAAYAAAITAAVPGVRVATWIHCPIVGVAVEIELAENVAGPIDVDP
jgi:ATP-dependent exoDNAse (exonuclease V) beta subunit